MQRVSILSQTAMSKQVKLLQSLQLDSQC